MSLERAAIQGDSPVGEKIRTRSGILSTAEHVKLRVKLPRPRGKAKYSHLTDSELVPRGKGEKNP